MLRVVVRKFNEVVMLKKEWRKVSMEQLKMNNVFAHGERVEIRVNDESVDSFTAPTASRIDRVPERVVSLQAGQLKVTCVPEVAEDAQLEATFRMEEGVRPTVALANLQSDAKSFELGKRYYLTVDGSSAEYYVNGVHYPNAIYSFIGQGSLAKMDIIPTTRLCFPYDGRIGTVRIVDNFNTPVEMQHGEKYVVVLNIESEDGSKTNQTHVMRRNRPLDMAAPAVIADHVVVITFAKDADVYGLYKDRQHQFGTRVEIALVQLKTAAVFRPHSRVMLELAGCKKLYSLNTDMNGEIDVSVEKLMYRESFGKIAFVFKYEPSGEVAPVQDGTFDIVFHLRIIEH